MFSSVSQHDSPGIHRYCNWTGGKIPQPEWARLLFIGSSDRDLGNRNVSLLFFLSWRWRCICAPRFIVRYSVLIESDCDMSYSRLKKNISWAVRAHFFEGGRYLLRESITHRQASPSLCVSLSAAMMSSSMITTRLLSIPQYDRSTKKRRHVRHDVSKRLRCLEPYV